MTSSSSSPPEYLQKPIPPTKPKRETYVLFKENNSIVYEDFFPAFDDDDSFNYEEYYENIDEQPPVPPNIRCWQFLSLQNILDLAPKNAKPEDVYLQIDRDADDHLISIAFFFGPRNKILEEKQFNQALNKYNKELQQYQKDIELYKIYETQLNDYNNNLKIQELENQLSQLKIKVNSK